VEGKFSNIFSPFTPIFIFILTNQCSTPKIVWFDDGLNVYFLLSDFDHFSFEDFSNVIALLELHDYDLLFESICLFKVQASTNNIVNKP
jgi:hypothetical protein